MTEHWKAALRIDPSSPVPVYAQIEDQMARLLASGAFAPGEQVPSVRELAIAVRVNPLTVSKAYARLAERGLVVTMKGRGVFVPEKARPMSREERERSLSKRLDELLAESAQLGVARGRLIEMLRERGGRGPGQP